MNVACGKGEAELKPYDAETIFPWSLVDDLITELCQRNARFFTYSELKLRRRAPRPLRTLDFVAEYLLSRAGDNASAARRAEAAFRSLIRRWGPSCVRSAVRPAQPFIDVILQHDADRQPYKTIEMLRRQQRMGVRSSAYFFRERNIWDGDLEPYDINIQALHELQDSGFEVGYHLNAAELEGYDQSRTRFRILSDVAWFRKHFSITSFVPHGGRPAPTGANNDCVDYDGALNDLWWVYNGRGRYGVIKDHTWSDGLVYTALLSDPRQVARTIAPGSRVLFLMHPQYYGNALMKGWEQLPIAREAWWRALWNL